MTMITLSFDNGPDPDVTPQVLDTLRRHDVKATFFVVGDKLRDRRALSERAHAEGHWIGNHTYNHLVPLGLTAERGVAAAEIARTEERIVGLAHERRFFRPFGGGGQLDRRLLNREAFDHLRQGGYTCVLWNVVPEDWAYPSSWVERALKLCFAEEHALLVLHDLPTGAMDNLGRFLLAARDRGAVFTQDFPQSCVLMERGRPALPVETYLTEAA
ncbi:Polysaccharide deacetylase [Tistlia consotensis]|uniref:Chitooligosaccharide deacetylase n=1 Tax=Tistlia consotensis USBA 355 TaxID=560819 RepID=A0A1Y6BZR6_9PROT|nr:polysaccharide deacetylase family protein [Tistlia consotensis]SMF36410.1 Polysaccharide deacetylase [Tistlia consotensis USBA 355]SNR71838.1 Polysaccharide deacetylase [Tistlia consotensis]